MGSAEARVFTGADSSRNHRNRRKSRSFDGSKLPFRKFRKMNKDHCPRHSLKDRRKDTKDSPISIVFPLPSVFRRTNKWQLCDSLQWQPSGASLMPRRELKRALKDADCFARLQSPPTTTTASSPSTARSSYRSNNNNSNGGNYHNGGGGNDNNNNFRNRSSASASSFKSNPPSAQSAERKSAEQHK